MLSDEEKKLRVKKEKDVPLLRFVLAKRRDWVMFRKNNVYRQIVLFVMVIQFFADICCLLLSFVRGIWTSWAINPLLIVLACFGAFGAVRVEPVSLFIHAFGCFIGLLIIVIGCTVIQVDEGEPIVWALHAPGIMDLICAVLTAIMGASLIRCGCCHNCCCLHQDYSNDNDAPARVEQGNAGNAGTASSPSENQPSSADSHSVEMEPAAAMCNEPAEDENFDDLDDEAKMLALQKKQQQQQQHDN